MFWGVSPLSPRVGCVFSALIARRARQSLSLVNKAVVVTSKTREYSRARLHPTANVWTCRDLIEIRTMFPPFARLTNAAAFPTATCFKHLPCKLALDFFSVSGASWLSSIFQQNPLKQPVLGDHRRPYMAYCTDDARCMTPDSHANTKNPGFISSLPEAVFVSLACGRCAPSVRKRANHPLAASD